MDKLAPLVKRDLPEPLSIKKLIGPSFILLGLGLGSGELILWPYLTSIYGLGIMWGAFLGITFQFFINMEVERYALVTGESVFVGLARKLKIFSPIWFILSTLIPWMWPGIIAASAVLLASVFGIEYSPLLSIGLLLLIGVALTLGPVIYKTQETFQRSLILIGVPFIFILVLIFGHPSDWVTLGKGLVGVGDGYLFLPLGISLATFIGAFAYAGAGGNLNLAQSFYVKEKGYGMGKYSGRITSILTGKKEKVTLTGSTFECNEENLTKFNKWWKATNLEHLIIFWGTGLFTMILLSMLAYLTVYGSGIDVKGIEFVLLEAKVIANYSIQIFGTLFLILAAAMLFSTQFSVMDATSRIMSENLVILSPKKFKIEKLSKFYYMFLWLQIAFGILIFSFGFTEPLQLVIIGAVLNAFAMFVYSGLLIWLNKTSLHKKLRPSLVRTLAVSAAFLFYGAFSILIIIQNIQK